MLLRNDAALAAYLGEQLIPFTRADDGALRVPIKLKVGVVVTAELRWARRRGALECVTVLPLAPGPGRDGKVVATLATVNRALPASRFVTADGDVFHLATADLNEDGTLPSRLVDLVIANTRVAVERHLAELLRVAGGEDDGPAPPRPPLPRPRLVPPRASRLEPAQLAELRREVAARRPGFAARLTGPLVVEELENPWFRKHRIVHLQSPSPLPPIGLVACLAPSGRVHLLAGHLDALNEVARDEGVELVAEQAARRYAAVVMSWIRPGHSLEVPVASFDDIPLRRDLPVETRGRLQRLRGELGGRVAPSSFTAAGDGWRLDVWLLSVARLIHRIVDVRRDGTLAIDEEIAAPALPVPPGAAWTMFGGRYIPVG